MQLLNTINIVLPVFLVIALGAILRKKDFISDSLVVSLNRLVYRLALPTLLFYKIATASYDFAIAGKTFIVVLAGTLAAVAVAYITAPLLKMPRNCVGTFVQGAFRSNLLYVGLPIVIFAFENSTSFSSDQASTLAIVVMAPLVPIYNIIAVIALLAGREKLNRRVAANTAKQIITNPILLACVAGGLYLLLLPPLPTVIVRTCRAVGQIALPSALLSIGATIATCKITEHRRFAAAASIIKIAVSPLAGLLVAVLLCLGAAETRVALILLACPAATVSFVMAEQLKGNAQLAAAIVLLSTVLSIISISIVITIF